jgi:hypothetical protein
MAVKVTLGAEFSFKVRLQRKLREAPAPRLRFREAFMFVVERGEEPKVLAQVPETL